MSARGAVRRPFICGTNRPARRRRSFGHRHDFALPMNFPSRSLSLAFAVLFSGLGGITARAADPLTRISEFRAWPREVTARTLPVQVRGVVTWQDKRGRLTLQDDTAGVFVNLAEAQNRHLWQGDDAILERIREGLEFEVEAISDPGGYAPVLLPRALRILG